MSLPQRREKFGDPWRKTSRGEPVSGKGPSRSVGVRRCSWCGGSFACSESWSRMIVCVLLAALSVAQLSVSAPVGNDSSAPSKEVDVVFYPSYGKNVQYDFMGAANDQSDNVTDMLPKPAVQVIFNPSFNGQVGFSHFGSGDGEVESGMESGVEPESGEVPVDGSGAEEAPKPVVEAIFYPSFKGRVYYHHFRADEGNTTPTEASTNGACVPAHVCYSDDDCSGGRCFGLAVGKCNCAACLSLLPCTNDTACGGLRDACDTAKKICDCEKGFLANGFKTIFDAWRTFCNQKECTSTGDACLGLPCNSGICAC